MINEKLKMKKSQYFQILARRAPLPFLIYNLSFFIFNCYFSSLAVEGKLGGNT